MSKWLAVVAALVLAAAAVGVLLVHHDQPPARPFGGSLDINIGPTATPGATSRFIDTSGGTCQLVASYTDASACTPDAANDACTGGQTVTWKGGSYGTVSLTGSNGRSSMCTLQAASGETVTLTRLNTDSTAAWITFKGPAEIQAGTTAARGWFATASTRITLDDVDITGAKANMFFSGGSFLEFRNAGFGTAGNTTPRQCEDGDGQPVQSDGGDDVTLYNVDFYPFIPDLGDLANCDDPQGNMHLETIRINGGSDRFTCNRCRMLRGDGSGSARIFNSATDVTGTKIVNSFIGATDGTGGGSTSVEFHGCTGMVVAYSIWEEGFTDGCETGGVPVYIANESTQPNYLPCPGSTGTARNLWTWTTAKTGCDTSSWVVGSGLAAYNLNADGYHLTGSSPGKDAGEQTGSCSYTGGEDIDGDARSAPCSAGPDE